MAEIEIALLQVADWKRFRDVRLRALADAPDAFSSTQAVEKLMTDAEWQTRVNRVGVAQYLASASEEDIGIVVCAPHTDYENTAGLFAMWVAPEARRKNVGKELIKAAVDWARQQKFAGIVLDVADDNIPAIQLYESMGFLPNGIKSTMPAPREHILEHQRFLSLK